MHFKSQAAMLLPIFCVVLASSLVAEKPKKPKVNVELKWVESRPVEGVTEETGFQTSCDPDSVKYPHVNPALVLNSTLVTEARLTEHDFSRSGLSSANYMVTLILTKQAREKLAKACGERKGRLLTVVVDGKPWGVRRYVKDKDAQFVPEAARAESFAPDVGFFSTKYDAQRLVDALRKAER